MTTRSQLRKAASYQPEVVEESAGDGTLAFTVHGHTFASAGAENDVRLQLPEAEADELLAAYPMAEPSGGVGPTGNVRIALGDIDGQQLNHWVRRAWLAQAPAQLVERALAADAAASGAVGDLPRSIGKPATRALADAGISSLDQVAELTEKELLALHGVGQRAVRVLRDTLEARGSGLAG